MRAALNQGRGPNVPSGSPAKLNDLRELRRSIT